MQPFCLYIRLMRLFRRIKPTNDRLYAIGANTRSPSFAAFHFRYPQKPSCFVAGMRSSLVLNVARCRNIAEVTERIIAWVAVNVIYITQRPFTSCVKPRQTTGSVSSFINADNAVTFGLNVPGNGPRNNFTARFDAPSKAPCFGVVVQQRAQLVKCDVKMAHAISLP